MSNHQNPKKTLHPPRRHAIMLARQTKTGEAAMTIDAIRSKIETQDTATLQDMARQLVEDFRDGVDLVLNEVLTTLGKRMSESEFVAFCDTI